MTDVFRKEPRELTQQEKDRIRVIKENAENLLQDFIVIEEVSKIDKGMMALAKTNLEQAVMWSVKSITG